MTNKGKLYLIPNLLGGEDVSIIPNYTKDIACSLDIFIVENVRNARRYLISLGIREAGKVIDDLVFHHLDKHAQKNEFREFLDEAYNGKNIGLISDAGCPAIADPGAYLVKTAHRRSIEVVPLVGPSSILLALMASGMNGQAFAFAGYVPFKREDRIKRLQQLEKWATQQRQTQIFIEAPYRNDGLLSDILQNCHPATKLCVAVNLTLPNQLVISQSIENWKNGTLPELHKQPAIFLLGR
ncbi:MAG: SAM-dependent methyltransferase [Chitinophagales bacterium]